jgi:hypothetical protein
MEHLTDGDIASATGATPTSVRHWRSGRTSPGGAHAERLAELSSIARRLALVMRPSGIGVWVNEPVPALNGDKPIDRIAQGKSNDVAELISGLEDPGAA